jgi:hypothetical protein
MASYTVKSTVYLIQRISVCRSQERKVKKNFGCCFLLGNPKVKRSREFIPHENNMYLEILADNKVYVSTNVKQQSYSCKNNPCTVYFTLKRPRYELIILRLYVALDRIGLP